jgi:membrane protein DedA with SNARE-associated domain
LLLALSSVTDSFVNLATHLIRDIGLAGVALLTMTSGIIGLPGSEPTMLFAGFNVSQGHLTMVGIIIAGTVGDIAGACIAYSIGYFGSHELIERRGRHLHVSPERINRAHRWFERYGSPTVLVSRVVPFVRLAVPYAAGVARMEFHRFVVLTSIGSAIWITVLAFVGRAVGSSWQSWRHNLEYVDYVAIALIIAAIAYVVLRTRRGGGGGPTPDVAG